MPLNDPYEIYQPRSTEVHSPEFWDSLTELLLTGPLLQEFNRRNAAAAPVHRPQGRVRVGKYGSATTILSRYGNADKRGLLRFSRAGGPDLSDVRWNTIFSVFDVPCDTSISPTDADASSTAEHMLRKARARATIYDRNFATYLSKYSAIPWFPLPDGSMGPKPDNFTDIRERLARRRNSLDSITDEDFETFRGTAARTITGQQVTLNVIPVIEGNVKNVNCTLALAPFNKLAPLADVHIVHANPALAYGSRRDELEQSVLDELKGSIDPTDKTKSPPILPNFFVEWNGADGSAGVLLNQALYNGILGARGFFHIQSFANGQDVYDKKAYTIVETYDRGVLYLYAFHPVPHPNISDRPHFIMTQLSCYFLLNDKKGFLEAVAAHRNARDWAEEQRNRAIELANVRAAAEA